MDKQVVEILDRYGVSVAIIFVIGILVVHYHFKIKVPHQKKRNDLELEKERSQTALNTTLAQRLPEIASSHAQTVRQVELLHDRHTETQAEIASVRNRVDQLNCKNAK